MAYFFYQTNENCIPISPYQYYGNPYLLNGFESFTNLGPMIENQYLSNLQATFIQNNLIQPETKISDTREGSEDLQTPNSEQKIKNSSFLKNQKCNRNVQKQLQSAKKNSQSNLVNQFLSYFSSLANSSSMIIKSIKKMSLEKKIIQKKDLQEVAIFFCKQISIVNSRRQRKYVNKTFLQYYFTVEKLTKYMPDILERVDRFQIISRAQFCELFRRCCFHFFRTVSVSSVTSSAKLNQISRPEHIKRRRLITQALVSKTKID